MCLHKKFIMIILRGKLKYGLLFVRKQYMLLSMRSNALKRYSELSLEDSYRSMQLLSWDTLFLIYPVLAATLSVIHSVSVSVSVSLSLGLSLCSWNQLPINQVCQLKANQFYSITFYHNFFSVEFDFRGLYT